MHLNLTILSCLDVYIISKFENEDIRVLSDTAFVQDRGNRLEFGDGGIHFSC